MKNSSEERASRGKFVHPGGSGKVWFWGKEEGGMVFK